jgi:carboxypeptidase Taq
VLYEQGRNLEYGELPVGTPLSMGIHESQSLTWERMVGLSPSFWEHFTPIVKEHFSTIPSNVTSKDMWKAINEVKFGLIRVEADEVTYPMHIILRYELERGLMDGSIQVENLPELWKEKMKKYLGIEVPSDSVGVLQDVHWSIGLFGYFPTYLLGAIYASQFFKKAEMEIPELHNEMKSGNFKSLREWLKVKIHQKGSLIPSGDKLTEEVTGQPLNPSLFLNYLNDKYTKLYQ